MDGATGLVLVAALSWSVGSVGGIVIGRLTVRGRVERFEIAAPPPRRKYVVAEIRYLSKQLGCKIKISHSAEMEDLLEIRNKLSAKFRELGLLREIRDREDEKGRD